MMPLAPTPIMPIPTKPKIGFSIESLVGQSARNSPPDRASSPPPPPNLLSPTSSSRPSSNSNASRPSPSPRSPSPSPSAQGSRTIESDDVRPRSFSPSNFGRSSSSHHQVARPHAHHHHHHHHHHSASSAAAAAHHSPSAAAYRGSGGGGRCESPNSPGPQHNVPSSASSGNMVGAPGSSLHGPNLSLPTSSGPFFDSVNSLKNIYAPEPTYTNGMIPGLGPQPIPCGPMAHLAHHPGIPNFSPLILGNFGGVGPHQLHRDAYPLYPWLLSRQGRFLGHRFQGPDAPAFLLQPFRKPKRIRTAFSPSQLLKLEHAFEKNHYVVGAERKHLAQNLSLTETQVKVWFQNRRTKHKRLKQEEEQSQCSPPSPKKKGSHHLNKWKMETNQSGDEMSSDEQ